MIHRLAASGFSIWGMGIVLTMMVFVFMTDAPVKLVFLALQLAALAIQCVCAIHAVRHRCWP